MKEWHSQMPERAHIHRLTWQQSAIFLALSAMAGCPTPVRPDSSIQTTSDGSVRMRRAVPEIFDPEVVAVPEKIYLGMVGVGQKPYKKSFSVDEAGEFRCRMSSRQVVWEDSDEKSKDVLLNFSVRGVSSDLRLTCGEPQVTSIGKEVKCSSTRSGTAEVLIQPSDPSLTVAFGFFCTKQRRVAAGRPAQPAVAQPIVSASPNTPAIVRNLLGVSDGSDDKHKVLQLACKSPLSSDAAELANGTRGTVTIGEARSSFKVLDQAACQIEVVNINEAELRLRTPVKLQR